MSGGMESSLIRKLRVKLTTSCPGWPLLQQTPGRSACWGDVEFFINKPVEECDAWFVYDGITIKDSTICPAGNVCFVTGEPSTFKRYHTGWVRRFDCVITSQRHLRHPHVVHEQTGLPWLVHKSYDELKFMTLPEKTGHISVIASNKTTTRGHRQRLAFVRELARQVPVEIFGRGFRSLEDKWDGLAPFRFSFAIENSQHAHYWTEKFSDCVLAGTIPIYHGCPNIADYFAADAYVPLNIHDVPNAVEVINLLLQNSEREYERRLSAVHEAHRLVLDEYNLFNLIAKAASQMNCDGPRRKRTISPEPPLGWLARRWRKFSRWLDRC
jgi:hypothetical protein